MILAGIFFCVSSPAAAIDKFDHSLYLRLGLGGRQIPKADMNRQFDLSASGGLKPENPDMWTYSGELSLGYQSPMLFGLELGLNSGKGLAGASGTTYGSYGDFSGTYNAGYPGSAREYTESISLFTGYVMPAIRLPMDGLFGRPSFHTLGLQLGISKLGGLLTTYNTYYNSYSSSYYTYTSFQSLGANSNTYTLCYRLEQMLGRRFSLGLDLSYHWAVYAVTVAGNKPQLRFDGSPLMLDFSGPSIKLNLGFWILRPFINAVEDKAIAVARAKRASFRLARRRNRSRIVDVNAEMAQRLLAKGDVSMDQQNYPLAIELYREAVSTDLTSRWAWQGLGNAQFYLGKKDEALAAYERAFELSDGDEKLQALIEKLKAGKIRE